jgi:ABC-2 type transport system ATP-binding protein
MLDHLARLKGLANGSERRDVVANLLKQVNLFDVRKKALGGFSGGMRQRFGIAQALLGDPRLVIVDEPTAGLDPEERVRFHNLLADIGRDVIVILSTHIVDDVEELCPRFAVIRQGRVVLADEPRRAVAAMRGRIWQRVVERGDVDGLTQAGIPVVSTRLHAGRTVVRACAPSAPPGFEPVEPDLEDVYFSAVAGYAA